MMKENKDQNSKRYEMLKQIYMNNRTKHQTIDSIWFQYLEQLNKAVYPCEIDETLDAIIQNQRNLGRRV